MLEKVMMKQQYGNIRYFLQAGYSILLMYAAKTLPKLPKRTFTDIPKLPKL